MSSLSGVFGRFLTLCFAPRPVIKTQGGLLVIRSGWRTSLLTLGGRHRTVSIDRKLRVIRIRDRQFWLYHHGQVIDFDRVASIIYDYTDLLDSWFSHDELDFFKVGVLCQDSRPVILFRFFGQGQFVNNSVWPDWMMWSDFVEGRTFAHNMESESGLLASVLSQTLAVPIGQSGP